jgi:hypothetical protein
VFTEDPTTGFSVCNLEYDFVWMERQRLNCDRLDSHPGGRGSAQPEACWNLIQERRVILEYADSSPWNEWKDTTYDRLEGNPKSNLSLFYHTHNIYQLVKVI